MSTIKRRKHFTKSLIHYMEDDHLSIRYCYVRGTQSIPFTFNTKLKLIQCIGTKYKRRNDKRIKINNKISTIHDRERVQ